VTIRAVELFSGIGAQASALENLKLDHEIVATSEIDKFAIASYNAIHGETSNLGDITQIERLPSNLDLVTYSFPCQDLSMAGKRRGMDKGAGTRSGLLWEVERLLNLSYKENDLPKVLLMENVDALLNEQNIRNFNKWISALSEIGYTSSYQVLNATDFGVPQNRRRCFMVSMLDDRKFKFPEPIPSDIRLRDVLEPVVDEKYFLSEDRVKKLIIHKERNQALGNGFGFSITNENTEPAKAITTNIREENCTLLKVGNIPSDGFAPTQLATGYKAPTLIKAGELDIEGWQDSAKRVYDPKGVSPAITTMQGGNTHPKIIDRPEIELFGELDSPRVSARRVYDPIGLCPTLVSAQGSGSHTKIVVQPCLTPSRENKRQNGPRFRDNDEPMFTLTAQDQHGVLIAEETEDVVCPFQIGQASMKGKRMGNPDQPGFTISSEDNGRSGIAIGTKYSRPDVANNGDGIILSNPSGEGTRVQKGISPTIKAVSRDGVLDNLRIRRLTSRECWRLMGFTDEQYDKAAKVCSESQLYKQAGNSIVVNVLEAIFDQIYKKKAYVKTPDILSFCPDKPSKKVI